MDSNQEKEKDNKVIDNKEKYKKMKKHALIDELIAKEDELKKKEAQLEENKEKLRDMTDSEKRYRNLLIRMQADFENYKKREEKKKQEFMEYAKKDLICQLLSVIDNLERAASYAQNQEHQPETIREGIKSTLKEFRKILEKEGLKSIKAVGEKFDPYCHEAIMQVESDQYSEDMVMEEITKGYYLKSKVIRPSVVKVSKRPSGKNQQKEKDETENTENNKDKNNNDAI